MSTIAAAETPLVPIARRLISALRFRPDDEYRVAVMKRVARCLGKDAYPAFIRILALIQESNDHSAKCLIASALGSALRRFDLPSGRLTSWGATRLPESNIPVSASALPGYFFQGAPERRFGPIEYLTVWSCQRTQRATLSTEAYADTLSKLVALMNHSAEASRLYPQKLQAHATNELEGAYTRAAGEKLSRIAGAWQANKSPDAIAQAATDNGNSKRRRPPAGWLLREL